MQRALTKMEMPEGVKRIICDAPLVSDEKIKDYNAFLNSIVDAIEPADSVEWLYVKNYVDLSWQILRERRVEASIIKAAEKKVVLELLKAVHENPGSLDSDIFRIFVAADQAERWANDLNARKEIEAALAAKGYGADEILAKAYQKAARDIDACEKRCEGYERRRGNVLRELGYWRHAFAKKLEEATDEIIDAEFCEAAE